MPGKYKIGDYPFSRAQLLKKLSPYNPIFQSLDRLATKDVYHFKDDFDGKAFNATDTWAVAAGDTATTWANTAALSGITRGVTGTTAATSGLQLYSTVLFSGDKYGEAEIRWKTSEIDELRFEFGFVDALPSINTTIVNNLSTPTFNTTAKGALYLYNHTSATTTTGLYAIGTGVSANKTATTTQRPTDGAYTVWRVKLFGNMMLAWVDGVLMGSAAIEGGDSLILAVSVKNNSTTSQNVDLDYLEYWCDRT